MNVARGTVVDRYTVEQVLGRGGMAVVYQVRHNQLDSIHAMKVLSVPLESVGERLLTEGRVQGRLRHPNVVAVTDVVDVAGMPGLVMEYVDGPSLEWFLRRHPLTLDQADDLGRGILRGAAEAHAHGLIHRDLKPSNILLRARDGQLVPKITDFGLAKILTSDIRRKRLDTTPGTRLGTPSYMAPEQITDASSVDARADVFSLGAILYELVTGHRAFGGPSVADIFDCIQSGSYVPPRKRVPEIPDRMEEAILGALQLDPADRIPDVASLLSAWDGDDAEDEDRSGPWDASLLVHVREAAQGPMAPDAGAGGSISDTMVQPLDLPPPEDPFPTAETNATAPVPEPRVPAAVPPVPGGPSASSLGWLLGAVALVLVLVVGTWRPWVHEERVVMTDGDVPVITTDAAVQGRFARAWGALLAGEFRLAERESAQVVEAVPGDARPHLLGFLAQVLEMRGATGRLALERAQTLVEEDSSPTVEVLHILSRPNNRRLGVGTYLEDVPDDHLASLIWIGAIHWQDPRTHLFAIEQAVRAHQHNLVPWYLKVTVLGENGRWDEADEAARAGLAQHAGAPALLLAHGRVQLARGDFGGARRSLAAAVAADQGLSDARAELANALLMLGDDEGLLAQRAWLLDETNPVEGRVRFARTHADALLGLGRVEEARAGLARARVAAREAGVEVGDLDPDFAPLSALLEAEDLQAALLSRAGTTPGCPQAWHAATVEVLAGDPAQGRQALSAFLARADRCKQVGWTRYLLDDARARLDG